MIDLEEAMYEKKTNEEIRIRWSFAHNKKYKFCTKKVNQIESQLIGIANA